MFKALKDNKIIAINESGEFKCLIYDSIEEDGEHLIEDYGEHNGEYLLKSDIPAPSHEEISLLREQYRKEHIDSKTLERLRKLYSLSCHS